MQDPSKPIWIKDKKTEVPNVKTLPEIEKRTLDGEVSVEEVPQKSETLLGVIDT